MNSSRRAFVDLSLGKFKYHTNSKNDIEKNSGSPI